MTKLRIIYAGTPEFALPCLKKIYDSDHDLLAVLTQPDRPAGRGLKLQQSAVKQFATEKKLTCYQPVKIELDFIQKIKELKP
ncbi:MAG: methionyl-tRNA formyltransferase, partial [Methylophilaceae bacterium]